MTWMAYSAAAVPVRASRVGRALTAPQRPSAARRQAIQAVMAMMTPTMAAAMRWSALAACSAAMSGLPSKLGTMAPSGKSGQALPKTSADAVAVTCEPKMSSA